MEYIEILSGYGMMQVLIILFALLFLFIQILKAFDWLLNRFGFKTKSVLKQENFETALKRHDEELALMQDNISKIMAASRESLAYKINERYKRYFALGYIPEDEYEEFIHLHDAYKGVNGNHSGDQKFNRCIENLPVKVIKQYEKFMQNKETEDYNNGQRTNSN